MSWWIWVVIGLVLLGCEMLTPGGFYLLFVGIAALVVGATTSAGWTHDLWLQSSIFAALSVALVSVARRPLLTKLRLTSADRAAVDDMIGESAYPKELIAAGAVGTVELRGTVWKARNASGASLSVGQRCRVSAVEGLTVVVAPEATMEGGK